MKVALLLQALALLTAYVSHSIAYASLRLALLATRDIARKNNTQLFFHRYLRYASKLGN